jgi:hypothetical protein
MANERNVPGVSNGPLIARHGGERRANPTGLTNARRAQEPNNACLAANIGA